jgi:glycosyltransferase involved in cell wall biosynthesis
MVLNVVHLNSAFARKNPLAAIAAFRRAFGDAKSRAGDQAGCRRRHRMGPARAPGCDRRRWLVEGMLMAASDIVIYLHRSEGFGLVPAQAMALGKPVIATGWSGNLEFMTERNTALVGYSLIPVVDPEGNFGGEGQVWADTDIDDAAQWLRPLASDAELRGKMGAVAAADIATKLSPKTFAATISRLLSEGTNRGHNAAAHH